MAKPFTFWCISIEKFLSRLVLCLFNFITGVFKLIIPINFLKCFTFPGRPSSANSFPNIVRIK